MKSIQPKVLGGFENSSSLRPFSRSVAFHQKLFLTATKSCSIIAMFVCSVMVTGFFSTVVKEVDAGIAVHRRSDVLPQRHAWCNGEGNSTSLTILREQQCRAFHAHFDVRTGSKHHPLAERKRTSSTMASSGPPPPFPPVADAYSTNEHVDVNTSTLLPAPRLSVP